MARAVGTARPVAPDGAVLGVQHPPDSRCRRRRGRGVQRAGPRLRGGGRSSVLLRDHLGPPRGRRQRAERGVDDDRPVGIVQSFLGRPLVPFVRRALQRRGHWPRPPRPPIRGHQCWCISGPTRLRRPDPLATAPRHSQPAGPTGRRGTSHRDTGTSAAPRSAPVATTWLRTAPPRRRGTASSTRPRLVSNCRR